MHNYIFELLQGPAPEEDWTSPWDYNEHPEAFPIADRVEKAENRSDVIACFGRWLKENQLGELVGERFTVDAGAADRYFEGRFANFQQAMIALQKLNEMQFIHEHDRVQRLIDELCETFTQKYSDYVLWGDDLIPTPMEEFLRKAQPGASHYIGVVLSYKY